MKFLSMLPMLLVAGISFGAVSSQTDWSGGSGVPGPVTDWGDCYCSRRSKFPPSPVNFSSLLAGVMIPLLTPDIFLAS